jgi:hypothetical protein
LLDIADGDPNMMNTFEAPGRGCVRAAGHAALPPSRSLLRRSAAAESSGDRNVSSNCVRGHSGQAHPRHAQLRAAIAGFSCRSS